MTAGFEAWLVKFPAKEEHAEVCAVEMVYAKCLRMCGIETPDTQYFSLPDGLAAFASKRFDRQDGLRVPMQSLAAFTGASYRSPGVLDYVNFLRATQMCTNDVREMAVAFERAVFNVAFNNRDDHPKNFAYVMSQDGHWRLSPAYDVTFCEGPGGYHQMDVMGEALSITRTQMLRLAEEAEVPPEVAGRMIDGICVFKHRREPVPTGHYARHLAHDPRPHRSERSSVTGQRLPLKQGGAGAQSAGRFLAREIEGRDGDALMERLPSGKTAPGLAQASYPFIR